MNKTTIKDELIDMYEYALMEAQSLWLSEFCCSSKEEKSRIKEDEEDLKHFKDLIKEL